MDKRKYNKYTLVIAILTAAALRKVDELIFKI